MPSKHKKMVTAQLDAEQLATLRKIPGDSDAERIRIAIMRGPIMGEIQREIRAQIEAAMERKALDVVQAVHEEIASLREDSPAPVRAEAGSPWPELAGLLALILSQGIIPPLPQNYKGALAEIAKALRENRDRPAAMTAALADAVERSVMPAADQSYRYPLAELVKKLRALGAQGG